MISGHHCKDINADQHRLANSTNKISISGLWVLSIQHVVCVLYVLRLNRQLASRRAPFVLDRALLKLATNMDAYW